MFCVNCGTQIPDAARFCGRCGAPQPRPDPRAPTWEICEIAWRRRTHRVIFDDDCEFWAAANGADGPYSAGVSPRWGLFVPPPSPADPATAAAHRALVEELIQEGWQPTGERGDSWWTLRFRRPVE